MKNFKRFFLWYTVGVLTVMLACSSYYRFMVSYDYEVLYEGFCDPEISVCFEYCKNEECSESLHYTLIRRQANELRTVCGDQDVLACEAASECTENEVGCSIEYCDAAEPDNECRQIESNGGTL
jgi:hypothetical protein